jgi:hypothetical protein
LALGAPPGPGAPEVLVYGSPVGAPEAPQGLPADAHLLGISSDFELPRELPPGLQSLWIYSLGHARALAAYDLPPDPR